MIRVGARTASRSGEQHQAGVRIRWLGEEVSLGVVATVIEQKLHLAGGFRALGARRNPRREREREDRADDGRVVSVGGQVAYEGPVDLEPGHREVLRVGKRRVADIEIIFRPAGPGLARQPERLSRLAGVAHERDLGDLDL